MVYVSVTGFWVDEPWHLPLFWWYAVRSHRQAEASPGNLHAYARLIDGCHQTLTVWESRTAMRAYLVHGAHADAMRAFPKMGRGRVHGYEAEAPPAWDAAIDAWRRHGRAVSAPPTPTGRRERQDRG